MRSNPIRVADQGQDETGGRTLRFGYLFYVDLVASTADVNTQNALRHLQARPPARRDTLAARSADAVSQEMAPFMRVLGCYPIDNSGRYSAPVPAQ